MHAPVIASTSNGALVCVVVPIYKSKIAESELVALRRCRLVLEEYPIVFVVPRGLRIPSQASSIPSFVLEFDPECFSSVEAYNKLLLQPFFYHAFEGFRFILIYQMDAYVFRDDLKYWCKKEYDYIGGVWFKGYTKDAEDGFTEWAPGNGGFSLRKVASVIDLLNSRALARGPRELWKDVLHARSKSWRVLLKNFLGYPIRLAGFRNTIRWKAKNFSGNEDVFFACHAPRMCRSFCVPTVQEASMFSWDRHPEYLFKKYKSLPFGCHAWSRSDEPYEGNADFWCRFIETS